MKEVLTEIYNIIMNIINSSSFFGPLLACFLILIESILPVLPLCVFITIVFIAYGYVIGFIISYILTSLGCYLSFFLCRKWLKNIFTKKVRKNNQFNNIMKRIDNLDFSTLVVIIALPFTPAFLVNIAAALSKMEFKKFAPAILVGKLSIVFFWGFVGTSLIESLKNPKIIVIVVILLVVSYILSKIVAKKTKIY